jgi:hypothetical protein
VAKRKKTNAQPWHAVFSKVRVYRNPAWVYVSPSTDAELDEVETQLNTKLPASYREFLKRFGSGEFHSWTRLHAVAPLKNEPFTVVKDTKECRGYAADSPFDGEQWLQRVVFFASSAGGDKYVWDPTDITSSRPHECQFYYLPRGSGRGQKAGTSFWEFVAWVDTDYRSWKEYEPDEQPPVGIEFAPRFLRGKKAPLKRDVRLWLAWNNNTARDLALSIRERGQTDAFPILADALQEAGCTNADLLDSCRTGDPDIDGAWVLRVLLGDK